MNSTRKRRDPTKARKAQELHFIPILHVPCSMQKWGQRSVMVRLGAVVPRKETAMGSFVDFAEVKGRCSIEQAAKLLGLQTIEERSQLRAPCPVCGGGPRAVVITPCVYRKPKPRRNDGEARRGFGENECCRSDESDEKSAHPCTKTDAF